MENFQDKLNSRHLRCKSQSNVLVDSSDDLEKKFVDYRPHHHLLQEENPVDQVVIVNRNCTMIVDKKCSALRECSVTDL